MERNARAGTPYELTPDSRLSKAPQIRDELSTRDRANEGDQADPGTPRVLAVRRCV